MYTKNNISKKCPKLCTKKNTGAPEKPVDNGRHQLIVHLYSRTLNHNSGVCTCTRRLEVILSFWYSAMRSKILVLSNCIKKSCLVTIENYWKRNFLQHSNKTQEFLNTTFLGGIFWARIPIGKIEMGTEKQFLERLVKWKN